MIESWREDRRRTCAKCEGKLHVCVCVCVIFKNFLEEEAFELRSKGGSVLLVEMGLDNQRGRGEEYSKGPDL